MKTKPRIAISLGDPNGIGPEVTLKSLQDSRLLKYVDPLLVGDANVLRLHQGRLDLADIKLNVVRDIAACVAEDNVLNVLDIAEGEASTVQFGEITTLGGALSMKAVEKAVDLCLDDAVDAMVTAPISKEAISLAGYQNKGHSGFIARRTHSKSHTMMMVSSELRVGLVTEHVPIWDVPKKITKEAILEKVNILSSSLINDFAVDRPRIAVLGLNPHAGDGGLLGREELDTIMPAIEAGCEQGHLVFGPFPADGFFAVGGFKNYDAVLAMYHDQGLIPFKTIAFGHGVNYTAGLPIVRTSPDHGTAYNIAGKGQASPESMRSAIYLALDIVRQRNLMKVQN
ncbi:MAG: 4-hydroxythreonine-4-phosphate dehydrogenase PdxA [Rhodothermales bacterium]